MRLKKTEKKLQPVEFDGDAMAYLQNYSWPGNIRELANFLQKCSVLYSGQTLTVKEVRPLMPEFQSELSEERDQGSFWDNSPSENLQVPDQLSSDNINDLTSYFSANQPLNLRGFLAEIEEKMISAAMQQSDGSMEIAAEKLGITPEDLLEKIKVFAVMNRNYKG